MLFKGFILLTCTCYPAVSIFFPVQMHNLLGACSFVGTEAGISLDVPFFFLKTDLMVSRLSI